MTSEFVTLLRIITAAGAGESFPALPETLDWVLAEKLAREQSVPGIWGRALYHATVPIPESARTRAKQQYFFLAAREAHRRTGILRLLAELESEGVRGAVLKGFAVGACYAAPECRVSGDVDFLIDPKDEDKVCSFLSARGFSVQRRGPLSHHDIAVHPILGMVEVHVQLYDEVRNTHWFEGVLRVPQRPFVREKIAEGTFWTLDPQDHMLFLLLHLAKHFVGGGVTLRMLVDCGLFYRVHADQLALAPLRETLSGLRLERFVSTCFYALTHIAGLDIPNPLFPETADSLLAAEMLLTDFEESVFVREDLAFSQIKTADAFTRRRIGKEEASKRRKSRRRILPRRLFPTKAQLCLEYPLLARRPLLLPAIWFVRSVKKTFANDTAPPKHVTANEKRLALFEDLDLF